MDFTISGNYTALKDGVVVATGTGNYEITDSAPPPPAPPPPAPPPPDNETPFWQAQTALLDPAALVQYLGTFSATVPSGEEWFLLNSWGCTAVGGTYYHRDPRPLELPSGFTLASSITNAFATVMKPGLVSYSDPKAKFLERMARLKTLPLYRLSQAVSGAGGAVYVPFPTDFENGLICGVDCFDAAWTILATSVTGLSNLMDEISDTAPQRVAGPVMLPFKRSLFPGIMVRPGGLSGVGSVLYRKLPSDW